jgi:DNA modification methylase
MNCKVLDQTVTDRFALYHGDSCEVLNMIPERSVDYSIFSPPFSSLYTYSNSPRDIGNVRDYDEFSEHFAWLIAGLKRVMRPGRNVSVHCMDLPTSKERHGFIGLFDFRGELIRAFQKEGFIYHSQAVIWKDPVTAMQRTKALGLLHKTVRENGSMSRQGLPDYLLTFRAPGTNDVRVTHTPEEYPVSHWQKIASPIWTDIDPSDTLQYTSAREHDDERHICPLQLEVIRRGVQLWTNRGETILSPFAGIGSEGWVALKEGRRFVGCELKASYYQQAARNLQEASTERQQSLFGGP